MLPAALPAALPAVLRVVLRAVLRALVPALLRSAAEGRRVERGKESRVPEAGQDQREGEERRARRRLPRERLDHSRKGVATETLLHSPLEEVIDGAGASNEEWKGGRARRVRKSEMRRALQPAHERRRAARQLVALRRAQVCGESLEMPGPASERQRERVGRLGRRVARELVVTEDLPR